SAEAFSQELARAMNVSAIATSGIRTFQSAPPPSSSAVVPSVPPAPLAPSIHGSPSARPLAGIPTAPLSDGSLSVLPSSTDSIQIAAGIRHGKRRWGVGVTASLLALGS